MDKKSLIIDDLVGTDWYGKVVVNDDPQEIGRARIKVYGKFDQIADDIIPWAIPGNTTSSGSSTGSGTHSVPKIGTTVRVSFDNGDLYSPRYHENIRISDELKNEISGDNYHNAQSLIFDTEVEGGLKVFYTKDMGLMLDLNQSIINIESDNRITIRNKNGDRITISKDGQLDIEMDKDINISCKGNANVDIKKNAKIDVGGKTTIESKGKIKINGPKIEIGKILLEKVIKGETFKLLFNSHTHTGNNGYPTGPPVIPLLPTVLSNKVKTE